MNRNAYKTIALCSLLSGMMILFPPVTLIGGYDSGYNFLFSLDVSEQINWPLLAGQISVLWFGGLGFFFAYHAKLFALPKDSPWAKKLKEINYSKHGPTIGAWVVIAAFIVIFHPPSFLRKERNSNQSVGLLTSDAIAKKNAEVAADFYGTYPELNRPEIKPLVQKVATQASIDLKKKAWDAELRDETARQVKMILALQKSQNKK